MWASLMGLMPPTITRTANPNQATVAQGIGRTPVGQMILKAYDNPFNSSFGHGFMTKGGIIPVTVLNHCTVFQGDPRRAGRCLRSNFASPSQKLRDRHGHNMSRGSPGQAMVGIDPSEPPNDQHQYHSHIGPQRDRWFSSTTLPFRQHGQKQGPIPASQRPRTPVATMWEI